MKKIIFSVALLSAGMMFTSCSEDLLDQEKKGVVRIDEFYHTDDDALNARTAMYAKFISEIGGTEGIWNAYIMGLNYSSDDVLAAGGHKADHADFRVVNEMNYSTSAAPIKLLYAHIFKAMYPANLIIENIKPESPVKKQVIAEARVVRAWGQLLATQVYYQPPLEDHVVSREERPTNDMSHEDLLKWCEKEAAEAAADLPERKGQSDKEGAWVVTKGFAQFVAAKAALFAGEYQKCYDYIKPLVESPNYALVPGERFRDLFHVEGDGCEEKIFEFNFTSNVAVGGAWGGTIQRGKWMVANVLNWRADDFPGKNNTQVKICSCNGWGGGAIQPDFAHKMLANDGDSYRRKATFLTSDEFMYDEKLAGWNSDDYTYRKLSGDELKKVRDDNAEKRKDGKAVTTLYKQTNDKTNLYAVTADDSGEYIQDKSIKKSAEDKMYDFERGISNTGGVFSRSDVMEVKMMMHPNDRGQLGDTNNNTNMCLARLAEAYLIYAEACIQLGKFDEATTYINKIQNRAGSQTVTENISSKEDGMKVLMDEKQYELWFEGCRWLDIVRWGIAKQCYDKVLDNIPMQTDEFFTSGGTKPHKLTYKITHPFADAGITLQFVEGKNEYWPLPQSEIEYNSNLHQVWGWGK